MTVTHSRYKLLLASLVSICANDTTPSDFVVVVPGTW